MTPFSSVAMLEKFSLLKIAFCSAPVFSKAASRRTSVTESRKCAGMSHGRARPTPTPSSVEPIQPPISSPVIGAILRPVGSNHIWSPAQGWSPDSNVCPQFGQQIDSHVHAQRVGRPNAYQGFEVQTVSVQICPVGGQEQNYAA